ncbi:hypothetical protein ACJRO7_010401 [Eucalyptus globulus]|uniref:MHD domain-containing protein n=1 Tax=Eucalyptus globulus TaxID=34317 RepID=A0ABD3LFB9_EUCGL
MPTGCGIRALWTLNSHDAVVFSRSLSLWWAACKSEIEHNGGSVDGMASPYLPSDSELASSFAERKKREGSVCGFGIRVSQSAEGSDSWVDDPVTRHVISIYIIKEEARENYLLWPLILHMKSQFCILVLHLVELQHLNSYKELCKRSDCGNAVGGVDGSLSSLLLDLPSVTGYGKAFMVAHTIGEIISGDMAEPEVIVNASPFVGGLLDSLTGSIGISSRAKSVAAPVASSTPSNTSVGAVSSDALKVGSRPLNKDALRTYISSSMPFGTPLDLNASIFSLSSLMGFLQPICLLQMSNSLHGSHIFTSISVSGQVNCRAKLEGLPDVSLPLTGLNGSHIESLSFHPFAQVPEPGADKQSLMFSPPLGNFVLMHYQASCGLGPPIKEFYQLSMVSEDERAFLFRLSLMEGCKAPLTKEFCTLNNAFFLGEGLLLWLICQVSFRIAGASLSGISVDPKSVSIYFSVKAPVEFSIQSENNFSKIVIFFKANGSYVLFVAKFGQLEETHDLVSYPKNDEEKKNIGYDS